MSKYTHRTIPIVDFKDLGAQPDLLLEAAKEWGCFRLINHPISPSLMKDMKATTNGLLDLPEEIKRRNITAGGYWNPIKASLFESLGLYNIDSDDAVDEFCSLLELVPTQRATIVKYSKAVQDLATSINQKLCQSMGLDNNLLEGWACLLGVNKYRFKPEDVGSTGIYMHSDVGFLTILQDDECVGGLEVMNESCGTFVAVDPLPGSLVVNFGDMAKVWSNGRFHNMRHRVLCKEASPRISIALFVLGPKDKAIEAPPELVDNEHPRLFVPLKIEDYRKVRAATGLVAGEMLAQMRISHD